MLKQLKGTLSLVFAAVCFGSYGIFSKNLASYDLFFVTYVRCFIFVAMLFPLGIVTKQLKPIAREDGKAWLLVLLATVFSITPITIGFRNLPLGTVSFLFYSSFTVCTYFLGRVFFKETITPVKLLSAGLAVAGLLLVFSVNLTGLLLFPILMTVFNGFTSSCEVVFSKNVSTKYSSLQVTLMVFLAIGVTHSAVSFLLGEHQDITLLTTAGGSLLLFCLAAIAGVIALYAGYRDLDPSIGALVGLTEIIFSVVFGMIFFQEVLNGNTIFGGLLILTAAALPNMYELWQARKGKKPIPLAA